MGRKGFVAEPGRLDAVVAAALGATRAESQRAIVAGDVTVDGQPRSKSFRLVGGERLPAARTPPPPRRSNRRDPPCRSGSKTTSCSSSRSRRG
jgi:hypothetical protein